MSLSTHFSRKCIRCFAIGLLSVLTVVPSVIHAGVDRQRIVAIGDVQGDFNALVAILQEAEIIDAKHNWIAGNTILVQTGDLLDRGPDDRMAMDLIMELEKQAPKQQGQVVALLGNHEVMNVMGDLRYVTAEAFAKFADKKSEKRQKDAYKKYKNFLKQRAKILNQPSPEFTMEMEENWMQAHPLGFLAHREAFAPNGKYGQWVRKLPTVLRVGNTIFLHGGISPVLSSWSAENINERIKSEIETFDIFKEYMIKQKIILPFFTAAEMIKAAKSELTLFEPDSTTAGEDSSNVVFERTEFETMHIKILEDFLNYPSWLSANRKGPLWFRGFSEWTDELGESYIDSLCVAYGVDHFVVGHTPQPEGRIRVRFDGKVFLIDTGMLSSYYGGQAAALEILNGNFTAIYLDEREVLLNTEATHSPPNIE